MRLEGWACFLVFVVAGLATAAPQEEYVIGGPLAGVKLPPLKTQHGEPPGYPGCLPATDDTGKPRYPIMGNPPLFELYPGSVEHWRQVLHRYVPARSFYDRQSQLRNWVAPDIPGALPEQIEAYAAPLYWVGSHTQLKHTGKSLKPVPVIRCRREAPVLDLNLGELGHGLYAVRLIGAVEASQLRPFRRPLFVSMQVNNGVNGEISSYRLRAGYVDEFYSVAEIYFHAPGRRHYRARVWIDRGSEVDLLLHNISLDDVLAGCTRRAVKTRAIRPDRKERRLHDDFARRWQLTFTKEERWARDRAIWRAFPPINCHPQHDDFTIHKKRVTRPGADGLTLIQIEQKHGIWKRPKFTLAPFVYAASDGVGTIITQDEKALSTLLLNEELEAVYTVDDWHAQEPLPAPYPYKDDGCGITTPDPKNPRSGQLWCPIAEAVNQRYRDYFRVVIHGAKPNHPALARDRAVALARLAYDWPTIDNANALFSLVTVNPGDYDTRCRRRNTESRIPWTHVHISLVKAYDEMFETIRDDKDLAASVSRFVPWVRSNRDLIELLDVYLLQTQAKRLMRYHYYRDGHPALIADTATILDDRSVTDPMMEWLFSRTWMYPLRSAGLPDYMISNTDRAGISYIGSVSYGHGAASWKTARILEDYVLNGGNPKFDLRDPKRYPKPVASLYFPLLERTAAIHWPRIGDVTGPDKSARLTAPDGALGWRWTKDSNFAFLLKNYGKRNGFTDAEWHEVETAAAQVKRAPWLENRSRFLPNWGAFLEAGVEHDDFRFRRSLMLRCGKGLGHSHNDLFDLQIWSHGIPMVVDAGQRPGYSKPSDSLLRVHNTVEAGMGGHGWVRAIHDRQGARYLCGEVLQAPPQLYRRQLALLDVDEGKGSRSLTARQCVNYAEGLPKDVVMPNSYVFDVFRVAGPAGKGSHTYCFHGPVNDPAASGGPQPRLNASGLRRLPASGEPADEPGRLADAYLKDFSGEKLYGVCPERLEVVFDVQKKRFVKPKVSAGTERVFLGPAFDPQSPAKHLRLHLLNAEGAVVMKGDLHCRRWEYFIPNVFIQRSGEDLQSAFAAVIEPYVGEPFITSVRRLPVDRNDRGARRAVAVRVETANGHTDVCFADARPEVTRVVRFGDAGLKLSGEFAYYSKDAGGLRQAALSGGTLLETPEVRIRAKVRERVAQIVTVDYPNKTFRIDHPWPALRGGRVVEIGTLPENGRRGYVTTITATRILPDGDRTVITTAGGADLYRSRIQSVDEAAGVVRCAVRKPIGAIDVDERLVASNDRMTRFWRAEMKAGGRRDADHPIRLTGGPVRQADFAPEEAIRLWEYGVGDAVRMVTSVSLRRVELRMFEVRSDVDAHIRFTGGSCRKSRDRISWTPAGHQDSKWIEVQIKAAETTAGPVYLTVLP